MGELHILKLGLIYSDLSHTDRLSVLVLLGTAQPLLGGGTYAIIGERSLG